MVYIHLITALSLTFEIKMRLAKWFASIFVMRITNEVWTFGQLIGTPPADKWTNGQMDKRTHGRADKQTESRFQSSNQNENQSPSETRDQRDPYRQYSIARTHTHTQTDNVCHAQQNVAQSSDLSSGLSQSSHNSTRLDSTRFGSVRYDLVRFGLLWFGLVRRIDEFVCIFLLWHFVCCVLNIWMPLISNDDAA